MAALQVIPNLIYMSGSAPVSLLGGAGDLLLVVVGAPKGSSCVIEDGPLPLSLPRWELVWTFSSRYAINCTKDL